MGTHGRYRTHVAVAALFLAAVVVGGCSHKPTPPPVPPIPHGSDPVKEKALFDAGFRALSKNDYKTADQKFSELLIQFPSTKWLPHAEYNLGLSLEGEGKFAEAAEQYKKVNDYYMGVKSRDGAEALYRLSVCYEALNDDPKVILALLELQNRTQFLSHDTADVEVPARLAAAYARQGNQEQARAFFSHAETGLKRLRISRPKGDTLVWLPKTLYSMGHIPPPENELGVAAFKNYLSSLAQNQIWLVRAAEMTESPYSKKAAEELSGIYFDLWNLVDKHQAGQSAPPDTSGNMGALPTHDPMQLRKDRQDEQKTMAQDLDASIAKLKLERIPPSPLEPESKNVSFVFAGVDAVEKRVDLLLEAAPIQDQETPEAQKREGLKREGVIKDPVTDPNQ